jgi:hypothetical protein
MSHSNNAEGMDENHDYQLEAAEDAYAALEEEAREQGFESVQDLLEARERLEEDARAWGER